MSRARGLVGRGLVVGSVAALATAGAMFAMVTPAGAGLVTFEETGKHDWVVPENVCWVTVQVWGAQGGEGAVLTSVPSAVGAAAPNAVTNEGAAGVDASDSGDDGAALRGTAEGGEGGFAQARIPVTPGETLSVNIGESGEDGSGITGGEGGSSEAGDGGDGGSASLPTPPGGGPFKAGGGGGGGASSVDRGDEELVIAGGGGGGGGTDSFTSNSGVPGGDGGGEGEDGATTIPASPTANPAAEGGEAGGEGGEGGKGVPPNTDADGEDGSHNDGGDGAEAVFQGGGGGGGGATGGGGGGATVVPASQRGGGGGGGGSGSGPDGTKFENGGGDGDGEVVISYNVPGTDACTTAIVVEPKFTG